MILWLCVITWNGTRVDKKNMYLDHGILIFDVDDLRNDCKANNIM